VDDVPDGRGVLFEVLRVDGTDKEINDAEYGDTPEGYNFLVTGHESFGRVLEAGPNVQGLQNRRLCGGHRQRPGTNIRCLSR
jgi:glucose 1-dehydrogenase